MSTLIRDSKRFSTRRTFDELPPRVIIHEILTGHMLRIPEYSGVNQNPLELFGYFARDRMRNIWFVFPSLKIYPEWRNESGNYDDKLKTVFDFRKMYSVYLSATSEGLMKQFSLKSSDMCSLRSLILECAEIPLDIKFFSSPNSFVNLKRLRISSTPNSNYIFNTNAKLIFKLEVFSCTSCRNIFQGLQGGRDQNEYVSDFFQRNFNTLQDIRVLDLQGMAVTEPIELRQRFCTNIYIIPGNKIDELALGCMDGKYCKTPYEKSINLRSLELINFPQYWDTHVDKWIFQPNTQFSNLTHLKLFWLDWDDRFNQAIEKCLETLEKIEITSCDNFDGISLGYEYKNLKHITVEGQARNTSLTLDFPAFPASKTIEFFEISEVVITERAERALSVCQFPNLRKIIFTIRSELSTQTWSNLLCNLVELKANIVDFIGDDFFQTHSMKKIQKLFLNEGCVEVGYPRVSTIKTGKNWKNEFGNLKELELMNLGSFGDDFFKEIDLPSLEILKLTRIHAITGEGWKELKNLKLLLVNGCLMLNEEVLEKFEKNGVKVGRGMLEFMRFR